jgi:hypothetical protein
MKKLLVCQNVCPIIAEKDHEIACLKKENRSHVRRLERNREYTRELERRLSKVRQAAFGDLGEPKITGGP